MTSQDRAFAQLRRKPVAAIECIGRRSCGEERGEGGGEREIRVLKALASSVAVLPRVNPRLGQLTIAEATPTPTSVYRQIAEPPL
jgi:hypothetical protein